MSDLCNDLGRNAVVIKSARSFLGDRMTTNATICQQHSHGEGNIEAREPDAVAFVESASEISRLLALCHAESVPVVPFGAGSSLEGQVTPVCGGISIDLSRMNSLLEVNAEDMDCLIEPGVTREQLNSQLRDQGLFFTVDPGAACTIGGMCGTRASGTKPCAMGRSGRMSSASKWFWRTAGSSRLEDARARPQTAMT